MNNVLILFAHPALALSRVHSKLLPLAESSPHVYVHDLYAEYPDYFIHAKHEKTLLNNHKVILMQFPFYWFSTPGILKSWQDIVLEYGYAFGEGGNALHGKYFGVMTSTGGRDYSFERGEEGYRYTVRDYLLPLESMAKLCGMNYLPPFVIHDSHRLDEEKMDIQTQNYCFYLEALKNVEENFPSWKNAVNMNSVLFSNLIKSEISD